MPPIRQPALHAPDRNVSAIGGGARAIVPVGVVLAAALPWLPSVGAMLTSGALYAAVAGAVLGALAADRSTATFGPANAITLGRAAATAFLAGAAVDPPGPAAATWWAFAGIAGLALLFDGVDGFVARRFGCCSAFGARFDMEVDAAFALVLTILLWSGDKVGPWILLLGSLRYLFVLNGLLFERFRRPLPPRQRRRAICALQGALLCLALVPGLPPGTATALCGLALAATAASFAIDLAALASNREAAR